MQLQIFVLAIVVTCAYCVHHHSRPSPWGWIRRNPPVNQPTCSLAPRVTKAIVRIDKSGTFPTSDGGNKNYHIQGIVSLFAINNYQTRIYGAFKGLAEFSYDNDKFSLHVHEYGDVVTCGPPGTGGHFNPCGKDHSNDPTSTNRHIGDVAQITLRRGQDTAVIDMIDTQVKLNGPLTVLGRSIVVHGGFKATRVGCGTIGVTKWDGTSQIHPDAANFLYN